MITARERTRIYDVGLVDYEPAHIEMFLEPENAYQGPLRRLRQNCCEKEPFTVAFIESIPPGGVLYDVGANVGGYSLVAAARGLQAVAFEPIPQNAEMLLANLQLNGWTDRVIVMQQGLATVSGLVWVHYADTRPGSATFAWGEVKPNQRPGFGWHSVLIPVSPLDELVGRYHLPPPTHLKIDVDGNEQAVLGGMSQVLALPSLVGIMIELQPDREAEIVGMLNAAGWSIVERWDVRNIAYARLERVVEEPTAEEIKPSRRKNGHVKS
jgi:FkbM family methyltransferase